MTAPYVPPTLTPVTVTLDGESIAIPEAIVLLSGGNPGAVNAIVRGGHQTIWNDRPTEGWIQSLWASRLRGPDLWHAYQYECAGDAQRFVDLIEKLAAAGGAR